MKAWGGDFTRRRTQRGGGQGPAAAALLREVCARATADLKDWPKAVKIQAIHHSLSITLARALAGQLGVRNQVLDTLAGGE